jgi:uncharacterized membrane protein YphA (DoxX/SURF4 family)
MVMANDGPTIYQHWLAVHASLRVLVPGFEMLLGIWLLIGIRPRAASFLTIMAISAFTGIIAMELTKDHPKPCGCMGAIAASYEPAAIRKELFWALTRNILMIGGACYCYVVAAKQEVRGVSTVEKTGCATPETIANQGET